MSLVIKSLDIRSILARHVLPISLFFILSLMVHRNSIRGEGPFVTNDLVMPLSIENYMRFFYPSWNFDLSIPTLSKLPQLIVMAPLLLLAQSLGLNMIQFLKIELVTIWALTGISMFYVMRYFLDKRGFSEFQVTSCALLAGIALSWNSFIICHMNHTMMRISIALAPILILCLWKGFRERRYRYLAFSGVLWTMMCGAVHWMVYGGIAVLCFFIVFMITDIGSLKERSIKNYTKILFCRSGQVMFVILLFSLTSAYWLIPGYFMGDTSRYGNIVTEDTLFFTYRSVSVLNILSLDASQMGTSNMFQSNDMILSSPMASVIFVVMGLTVLLVGLSAPFFRNERQLKVILVIMSILGIFQTLMMALYPGPGTWFVLGAPLHSWYGWAFRTPKFVQFLFISISFLVGFSTIGTLAWVDRMIKKERTKILVSVSLIVVLLLSIMVPNWPLATGDHNGTLLPVDFPEDLEKAMYWIDSQDGDFKVLWIPDYRSMNVDWNPGTRTNKDILSFSTPKPTYYFDDRHAQPNGFGIFYLEALFSSDHEDSLLYRNATDRLGSILFPLGVKYVVFHDDNATTRNIENRLLQNLRNQKDMALVENIDRVYIFENRFRSGQLLGPMIVSDKEVLVFDGLSSIDTLYSIPGFDPSINIPIYAEQTYIDPALIEDNLDVVYMNGGGSIDDIALSMVPQRYWIQPFKSTTHSNEPQRQWLKKFTEDMTIPSVARQSGTTVKDWSYGSEFVFTYGEGKNNIKNGQDGYVTNNVLATDFYESYYPFNNANKRTIFDTAVKDGEDEVSLHCTILPGEDGKTIQLDSALVPISNGRGYYNLSVTISAHNALNLQVKVVFYNVQGLTLEKQFLLTKSGTFGKRTLSKLFELPSNVHSMKVSVLCDKHPIKTTEWWMNNLTLNYIEQEILKPNRLSLRFDVDSEAGNYEVFIRHLLSPKGGILNISTGTTYSMIETRSDHGGYVWTNLGTYNLKGRQHVLKIDNIEGFNAVNLAIVVPVNTMESIREKAMGIINRTALIQSFELECINGIDKKDVVETYGAYASNGLAVRFHNNDAINLPFDGLVARSPTVLMRVLNWTYDMEMNVTIADTSYSFNCSDAFDGWINITSSMAPIDNYTLFFRMTEIQRTLFQDDFEQYQNVSAVMNRWTGLKPIFLSALTSSDEKHSNTLSLTTRSNLTKKWSNLISRNISVSSPTDLEFSLSVRQNNSNPSHVKIMGFNTSTNEWEMILIIANKMGTLDWKYCFNRFHVPENISTLRIILNAGTAANKSLGNSTVEYDNILLREAPEPGHVDIDTIHLLFSTDHDRLEDVFNSSLKAKLISVKRDGETSFRVEVNSEGPFTVVLRETYDDTWLSSDSNGRVESIPVYGMLNGFMFNCTGNVTVRLYFAPQTLFEIGIIVSILTLVMIPVILVAIRMQITKIFAYPKWIPKRKEEC